MCYRTDNPIADFERHERQQQKWLERLPVCDICDEPIQDDHYYLINGDNICPDCMENRFRKEVDLDD